MDTERHVQAKGRPDTEQMRVPPPVRDGTMYLESLGRWVDNLLGDERIHRSAQEHLARYYLGEDEAPADPAASESPPPVPDRTGTSTRGGRPGERKDRSS